MRGLEGLAGCEGESMVWGTESCSRVGLFEPEALGGWKPDLDGCGDSGRPGMPE